MLLGTCAAPLTPSARRSAVPGCARASALAQGQSWNRFVEGRGYGALAVRGNWRRADLVPYRRRPPDRLDYLRWHRPPQGHRLTTRPACLRPPGDSVVSPARALTMAAAIHGASHSDPCCFAGCALSRRQMIGSRLTTRL